MRVVGYIHQGEPGHAIIRRRPTVALRRDVMLTFRKEKKIYIYLSSDWKKERRADVTPLFMLLEFKYFLHESELKVV